MSDTGREDAAANNLVELRRGTVVLASLIALRTASYGYALLDQLGAWGLDADANTLYPLLRRLEKQGLLASEWNTDEARPRKFYSTTTAGDALAAQLTSEWERLDDIIRRLTLAATDTAEGAES
ncbi:MAG TPA: PadR family transcriptional regulator [Terrimesophilobacter sp.]|nr:PadR family transcriptional regulator [Terrimesophilobacter sp.]HRQ00371.1 PadR family transcriptional regulator [Terrimesophilobacter sp.]